MTGRIEVPAGEAAPPEIEHDVQVSFLLLGARRALEWVRVNFFIVVLLAATFTTRLVWAAVVPAFETPDEIAHYGYIQSLGENWSIAPDSQITKEVGAVEVLAAPRSVPGSADNIQAFTPASLDGRNEREIEALPDALRESGQEGRSNPATQYPPAYYLLGSVVYRITDELDIYSRMFALRILSSAISTATVLFIYLTLKRFLADELVGKSATLVVALSPMYAFAGMAVNPDVLVYLGFAVFLYLCTRMLDEGINTRTGIATAAVLAFGLLIKQTFLVALPVYGVLLAFLLATKKTSPRDAATHFAISSGLVLVTAAALFLSGLAESSAEYPDGERGERSVADFFVHLGDRWYDYSKTFDTFWGSFGWQDTPLSDQTFDLIRFGSGAAGIGLVFYLIAGVVTRSPDVKALFFLSAAVVYIACWVMLNYVRITGGEPWLLQGRYFFPIIAPVVGLLMRGLLWYIPSASVQRAALVAVVIGILWLQVDSLFGYVVPRYYL